MKIEEIESQWKHLMMLFNDYDFDETRDLESLMSSWAEEFGLKLLAVAKAAKNHIESCQVNGIGAPWLEEMLEELEK